jgi:hypothetical protein
MPPIRSTNYIHITYTMIRTLLRTPTLARATPRSVVAGRSVTTRAPTNSSGTPSTDIAGTLAPGEEIDPQRMSPCSFHELSLAPSLVKIPM